jgi:hypothetical protein
MRLALHHYDSGRRVKKDGPIRDGGRITTARARLKDESGRLYRHTIATCIILREGSKERSVGEGG